MEQTSWIHVADALPLWMLCGLDICLLRDLQLSQRLLVQSDDCIAEDKARLLDAALSQVGYGALSAPTCGSNLGLGEASRRKVCQYFYPVHIGTITEYRFIVKRLPDIGSK